MIPTFKIVSISIETETYMKFFKIKVIIELRDMTIFIKHQYQTHPNYLTKNNIIWNDLIFNIVIKLLALNIKCGVEFKFNTTKLTTSLYYCKNVHTDHSKELLRIIYYWGFENVTEIQLTELNLAIKIAKAINEVHPYIEAKERIYLIENQIKTKKYLPVIEDYINKLQQ